MNYNPYPYSYYPQYQYPQPQSMAQPQQTPIIWVTSEDVVKNYSVAPGGSVLFMHETEPFMYMKSADQLGKSSLIKKRLVDETEANEQRDYLRREEVENIIQDAVRNEVEKRISEISFKPTKKKQVIVDEED